METLRQRQPCKSSPRGRTGPKTPRVDGCPSSSGQEGLPAPLAAGRRCHLPRLGGFSLLHLKDVEQPPSANTQNRFYSFIKYNTEYNNSSVFILLLGYTFLSDAGH